MQYSLNHNFAAIESEVIDRLDKQFAAESPGIEAASTTFVEELAALFDDAADEELRSQVNAFVALVSDFLGLLTGVQSLPEGSEVRSDVPLPALTSLQWQEDRVILTLKLMSFVRGIGRSDVFVRYVNRIVDYHVASEHFTEAGMTLKLHADLYDWSRTTFASAIGNSLPRATNAVRKECVPFPSSCAAADSTAGRSTCSAWSISPGVKPGRRRSHSAASCRRSSRSRSTTSVSQSYCSASLRSTRASLPSSEISGTCRLLALSGR